ncbi:hypothetical protein IKS86_04390 [bacterium]|nr:hypothetical protein [bacterium]
MSENRPKLPSSITNPKLRALYAAALNELDRIRAEVKNALIYAINNAYNMPIPDALPFLAKDLNVHGLEYLNAENTDGPGVYTKQREVTQKSFELHKEKGTAGIIEKVAQMTGRTDINIEEWFNFNEHLSETDKPMPPFTFKVTAQMPLSQYECDVIFGLIKDYKRFVCRELNEYLLQLYRWVPANGLTVGRYVDYITQPIPGFISISSIVPGETIRIGTNVTISGVAGFDDGKIVSIYRGETLVGVTTVSDNAYSYTWRAAGESGDDFIRVVCEGAESSVSVQFVVVIIVNEPVENQAVTVGTAFGVSVTSVAEGNVSVYIGNALIALITIVDGLAEGTAVIPDSLAGVGSAFIVDGGGETPAGGDLTIPLRFADANGDATVNVKAALGEHFVVGTAEGTVGFTADRTVDGEFALSAAGQVGYAPDKENAAEFVMDAEGTVNVTEP